MGWGGSFRTCRLFLFPQYSLISAKLLFSQSRLCMNAKTNSTFFLHGRDEIESGLLNMHQERLVLKNVRPL